MAAERLVPSLLQYSGQLPASDSCDNTMAFNNPASMTAFQWDDHRTNCRYNDQPTLFTPEGFYSAIAFGAFVRLPPNESNPTIPIIGRLYSTSAGGRSAMFQVFLPASCLSEEVHGQLEPLNNCPSSEVMELIETLQTRCIQNDTANVSLCFVFSQTAVDTGFVQCTGMSNAFFCRYRYNDGKLERTTLPAHPFFRPHFDLDDDGDGDDGDVDNGEIVLKVDGQCYHSKIWKWTCIVQETMKRVLHRFSEKQGSFTRYSLKVAFSGDCWEYIKECVQAQVPVHTQKTKATRTRVSNGLKFQTLHMPTVTEILRFETKEQLNLFRSLFGSFSTFGYRQRRPRIGTVKSLCENDIMNVVAGNEEPEEEFRRRTVESGIDLSFDAFELTVTVRYEKYIYHTTSQNGQDGAAVDCPCDHLEDVMNFGERQQTRVAPPVSKGNFFRDSVDMRMVLKVMEVNVLGVSCQVMAPRRRRNEIVTYKDKEAVGHMIAEYNQ
jgi:hypothetical protein